MSAFLASCTAAVTDPDLQAGVPGYNSTAAMSDNGQVQGQVVASTGVSVDEDGTAGGDSAATAEAGDLPQKVAALPAGNPTTQLGGDAAAAIGTLDAAAQATPDAQAAKPGDNTTPAVDPATAGDGTVATAVPAQEATPVKPKTGLAAFFSNNSAPVQPRNRDGIMPGRQVTKAAPKPAAEKQVVVASAAPTEIDFGTLEEPEKRSAAALSGDSLPGVRKTALFEIKRRSGLDDDADVDIYEEEDNGPIQMASAAGMARLAPNGLRTQTESVDVACLKPSLVRVLKAMERHYGKAMVVTSGYRSPTRNRRARGAKNSLHMYCAAADVQIPGVGKWELASYARSMAGRGGVGTYCHTNSVHVDVGPERDWNWRCRGRRRK